MSLASDFAGLFPEHTDLVTGLCEVIKLRRILGFDDDAINYMLQSKNLQLLVEDEHFVSSIFLKMNESLFPSEPARGFYGCSSRDTKIILRPAKPMKSTRLFSLDFLLRWEMCLFLCLLTTIKSH